MPKQDEKQIAAAIAAIRALRLAIFPPYTYDQDEDEKSETEYREIFAQDNSERIKAIGRYLAALHEFAEAPESETIFHALLHERRLFIQTIPFCYDEMEDNTETLAYVRKIYKTMSTNAQALAFLEEYQKHIRQVHEFLH